MNSIQLHLNSLLSTDDRGRWRKREHRNRTGHIPQSNKQCSATQTHTQNTYTKISPPSAQKNRALNSMYTYLSPATLGPLALPHLRLQPMNASPLRNLGLDPLPHPYPDMVRMLPGIPSSAALFSRSLMTLVRS